MMDAIQSCCHHRRPQADASMTTVLLGRSLVLFARRAQ